MKLTRVEKKEKAKKLSDVVGKAPYLFFTEYQGLKFLELADLRGKLGPLGGRYSVVKNSQLRHALKGAGIDGADPKLLKGPLGLVVSAGEDPVSAAKVLAAFAKQFPVFKIKAGYVGQRWMTAVECQKLSSLGTRPEMLAKLVGLLYANVAQSAAVLSAPLRDFVFALSAVRDKKEKEIPAAAAA
ncbi:MAG: 50S ribosomal protein L10 [Elusimicrobiota bacterium]